MAPIGKKLVSNALFLFLDWFIIFVFSLLFWFIVGKMLLPQDYGIIATSISIMTLLTSIVMLGLSVTLGKLIPEYLAKKQTRRISSLIKFSIKTVLISNLVVASILIIFSSQLAQLLKFTQEVIYFIVLGTLFNSLLTIFGAVIYGFQNMRKLTLTDFYGNFTKVVIPPILILFGFGYFGPIIGMVMSMVVICLTRFEFSWIKTNFNRVNKREVIKYSLAAFIGSIAWIMFHQVQYIILTILKNPEITGIFAIGLVLSSPLFVIPNILTASLFPIISQLCADRDGRRRQSYLMSLLFKYLLLISLPLATALALFSKPIILLFSQPQYLPATKLLPLLAFGAVFFAYGNFFLSNLYAIRKPTINRNISVATAVLFLALALPLTYLYSSFGLASAYFTSTVILTLVGYYYLKKHLPFDIQFKNIFKIVFSLLVFLGLLYVADVIVYNFFVKLAIAFIAGLVYLIVLIPLKFYSVEDIKIINAVGEKIPTYLRKYIKYLSKFLMKFV